MAYIKVNVLDLIRDTTSKNVVEIGSQHPVPASQKSTEYLLTAVARCPNAKMWTVDIREDIKDYLKGVVAEKECSDKCEVVTSDGEKFLKEFDKNIAFLYLDNLTHRAPAYEGEIYKDIEGYAVSESASEITHLQQAKIVYQKVEVGGHILFDDTKSSTPWTGKGALAIPWLLKNGYRTVIAGPPQTLLKREA